MGESRAHAAFVGMADRTGWLQSKVKHSLGVSESIFSELLERQGPDGKTYWESLNAFLDYEDTVESVIMFYTTEEIIGGTEGTSRAPMHKPCVAHVLSSFFSSVDLALAHLLQTLHQLSRRLQKSSRL